MLLATRICLSYREHPDATQRDELMHTSEKFLRFAAECEFMADLTHNTENRTIWKAMAERWLRCAELLDRQSASVPYSSSTKQRRKPTHSWGH